MKAAAIVLAAGGSLRLGQPKQLLQFRGESLIRRIARAADGAGCRPIVVVLGRDQELIAHELGDLPVTLVPNEKWERGLGTSIRAGVLALPPEVEAVVILACDQPHVDAALLQRMMEEFQRSGKPMVGSTYVGTVGVPALFARVCFAKLESLGDGVGAKSLLQAAPDDVRAVDFPAGAVDIDTAADYEKLQQG